MRSVTGMFCFPRMLAIASPKDPPPSTVTRYSFSAPGVRGMSVYCEDRVLVGPASGGKGSKGRN